MALTLKLFFLVGSFSLREDYNGQLIGMIIAAWWPHLALWPWSTHSAPRAEKPLDGRSPRPQRPSYGKIHASPLPVNAYPFPPLIPHNPLSILHIVAIYLRQCVALPPSHPEPRYQAIWDEWTGTVQVTDKVTIRALWERGFFGKGSLSRSEPTWLEREKKRLGVMAVDTSEQYTRQRREERRQFKNERARKEREAIEERLRLETGEPMNGTVGAASQTLEEVGEGDDEQSTIIARAAILTSLAGPLADTTLDGNTEPSEDSAPNPQSQDDRHAPLTEDAEKLVPGEIPSREHLQLSHEEAFFLAYALGVLTIRQPYDGNPESRTDMLTVFCTHATFPPSDPSAITTSNPFLISYVVYHHFRSLGWVVRSGIKFGVDYLLYQRGPAFAHAQFSVIVVPSYRHPFWKGEGREEAEKGGMGKSWWWLHAVNRVQSQVLKNLVIVFVEVPPPAAMEEEEEEEVKGVAGVLGRYKVREMVLKRWTPNRSRD